MTDLAMKTRFAVPVVGRFWQRIPVLIRAIVVGLLVTGVGIFAWVGSLTILPGVWPLVVMGVVLVLFCRYFAGSWWPAATAETRRNRFRALKLSGGVWTWTLAAGMLLVTVWQSSLVLTFRITEFPAESFTIWNLGSFSERAQKELAALGWKLHSKVRKQLIPKK